MTIPVLFHDHFQLGYVVRDMERAIDTLSTKFGVTQWRLLEMPPGMEIRLLAFAYVQDMMFELIELNPDKDSFYRSWVPESPAALRLNHLGYLMQSDEQWDRTTAQFEAAGYATVIAGDLGGVRFVYYDTVAELGHYCELNYLAPEAKDFYTAPRN